MIRKILRKVIGSSNLLYLDSVFGKSAEPETVVARRKFYQQFLQEGGLFFDVGANLGNRIEPIIDLGIQVVAVEPQEQCIRILKRKFGGKITIIPKGLGAKDSKEIMYLSEAHTLSSFSKDWIDATKESGRFSQYKWEKSKTVQITTFDRLIEQYGTPDFAKIDVEGYEYEVLRGLNYPIPFLSIEYTVPEKTDMLINCLNRISSINNGSVAFNYSPGETMEWGLKEWLSLQEMITFVQSPLFLETQFGDVYSKSL